MSEKSKSDNESEDINMSNNEETDDDISSSKEPTAPQMMQQTQSDIPKRQKKPKDLWKNRYLANFPWIQYDAETRTASCSFHRCNAYNSLE